MFIFRRSGKHAAARLVCGIRGAARPVCSHPAAASAQVPPEELGNAYHRSPGTIGTGCAGVVPALVLNMCYDPRGVNVVYCMSP